MAEQIAISLIVYLVIGLAMGAWIILGRLDYFNAYFDSVRKLDGKPYDTEDRIVMALLIVNISAFVWPWFLVPSTDQS